MLRILYHLSLLGISAAAIPSSAGCLDITDFGAVKGNPSDGLGDYWESNTAAIQAAMDKAGNSSSSSLRQCVVVRGGDYITAAIEFRSHVTLIIEEGSRLITAAGETMPALLTGTNVEDIELTGGGVVYGNAEHFIDYYDPVDDRYEPIGEDGERPRNLKFISSRDIYVHDIKLENSSSWNGHFQGCRNVTIDRVSIYGDWRFPNTDGIDPDSCIDFYISNSYINTADDGVCPKTTAEFGPLRNLVVRNTTIRSKSHAIKFGSNTDAEMSDIIFENITIWDSNSGLSIQQRSGGNIHNVTYRNINIETRYVAPRWWGNGEWLSITAEKRHPTDQIGRTYDIVFENINAVSENGGLISGRLNGVQGLIMRHITVELAQWSNYSTGQGPPCQHGTLDENADNEIYCMGTQDHRPSYSEVNYSAIKYRKTDR